MLETKVMHTKRKLERQNKVRPQHDLIHYAKCPQCHGDYIGKIGRRLSVNIF